MASVTFDDVSKDYGAGPVVAHLSLAVKESEFLVLLGPSGCGKTTSLRMVAGFIEPSAGRISIGGEDVTRLPPRRRNIGMVFQDYALFPNMTVAENIGFGLRERRTAPRAIAQRVGELLDLIRLPGLGDRYPGQLSGGQQQRVGLARALAFSPRVLLMDEPLGALDLKLREAMQVELQRVQRALAITTILVTHDQEEAMNLADRIAILAEGRLQQIGPPEELYTRPATSFVAHFIGKINFLSGLVASVSPERCTVTLADGTLVGAMPQAPCAPGQKVQLAIRPQALRLIDAADRRFDNRMPARIERRRFLGNIVHYFVSTAGAQELMVESSDPQATATIGEVAWIGWRPEEALAFPADPAA